ncbi:MAG: hypothetical protein H6701_05445 [Myxococcales bacterium]|nr:hypothetical protein [Myxococcales bacterium]
MRSLALIALALFGAAQLGCDGANAQEPQSFPVTAGPAQDIILDPGDQMLIPLERATDPAAVDQTVGLILPAGRPVMLSAYIGISEGRAIAEVVTGQRGDPIEAFQSRAWVATGVVTPLVVWPDPGELAAIRVTSTDGAVILAGDAERRTWLTAVPLAQ